MNNDVLVLRSLNYLRSTHLPSYVALRMLLESVDPTRLELVVDALVMQATMRKHDRVLALRRFKSHDGDRATYRDYFVPSPTSVLADTYALGVLHDADVLQRHEDVFSYRPPPTHSYGRNFEYFADGYRARNDMIAAALGSGDAIALVTDITNFYPSVDGERALAKLLESFSRSGLATRRDSKIVEVAARRAISDDTGGLQVGLELSHALASVYLRPLDEKMRAQFPSRYFRYVDDVVIVVNPQEVSGALAALDRELKLLGLKRNPKKDSIANGMEWGGYRAATKRSITGSGDCLRELKFRTKLFLARHPDQAAGLGQALLSQNVYLPLDQLMSASRDFNWRRQVLEFFRSNWRVVLKYRFDVIEDIAAAAAKCRTEILALLTLVLSRGIAGDPGSIVRRWQVQSARFAINRALYFADSSDLTSIVQFTKDVEELFEAKVVCEALGGDFSGLALTPGPAVAAGAQLLSLRGVVVPEDVAAMSLLGGVQVGADFEAHLALRGLVEPFGDVEDWPDDLRGLIALSRSERVEFRGRIPRYGDEVSSLATNFSSERAREIAKTRFMSAESIVLDALSLDSGYGS